MKQVLRVGVVGVGRGGSMMAYSRMADHAKLVAICDKWEEGLNGKKNEFNDPDISYYTDYDEFLTCDMDVVVLANYANEHAPFAIKAMDAGFHVISEVLPCQTMQEAVGLVEAVERTGKKYCYAENYCYMPAPYEMKKRYRAGQIGELTYAEGEYIHNCEGGWAGLTYGDRNHWRNNMCSTFYCTHSIGPIVHITGMRPVKVSGFEVPFSGLCYRSGIKAGLSATIMMTMENGGIVRSTHGGLDTNSIWYSLYATEGRFETAREVTGQGVGKLYADWHEAPGDYSKGHHEEVEPNKDDPDEVKCFGHSGSDYYCLKNAFEYILGNPEADAIDVYEALDMFLPGLLAYRSILAGGAPMDIPNFRNKEEREPWRNDTACTDPKVAGDMLLPSTGRGNPEIPDEIYEKLKNQWLASHTER